ncbi:MAG: hypothetical protein A7316_09705 [Candidatus Altiarchaeales archaeon WOR_SM1_86-2]|nr:MAG: hypothetical protein A7316_09705 [Candidatus Altiarchaeales archaeon WOR_SM1_86-2]ODS39693.1 MAG: hypothetical protein A7315_10680 [Candidatus Altiarchaeales archaeon WOR_SM1_79]
MKSPCELVVWYLLPAIRSELSKELGKNRFKQKDIAEKLGITPAAVCQYISEKRGQDFEFSGRIKRMIKNLAKRIVDEDLSEFVIMEGMCAICLEARKSGLLCEIHREVEQDIPEKCDYWSKVEECVCKEPRVKRN